MKHAFLVIAHNNWWQLKQLLQMLDAENHDFYLHVDRKSHDFPQDEFEQLPLKQGCIFIESMRFSGAALCRCRSSFF